MSLPRIASRLAIGSKKMPNQSRGTEPAQTRIQESSTPIEWNRRLHSLPSIPCNVAHSSCVQARKSFADHRGSKDLKKHGTIAIHCDALLTTKTNSIIASFDGFSNIVVVGGCTKRRYCSQRLSWGFHDTASERLFAQLQTVCCCNWLWSAATIGFSIISKRLPHCLLYGTSAALPSPKLWQCHRYLSSTCKEKWAEDVIRDRHELVDVCMVDLRQNHSIPILSFFDNVRVFPRMNSLDEWTQQSTNRVVADCFCKQKQKYYSFWPRFRRRIRFRNEL